MGKTVGNLDKHIQIDLSNFSVNGHTHDYTTWVGDHAEAATGSTANSPYTGMAKSTTKGLYLTGSYNDANTPVSYGNILNLAGRGTGQLLCEWKSGTTSSTGDLYYRSHRDNAEAPWGPWKKIAYTDSNITGNAATATKLAAARTITIGNQSNTFDGSANISYTLDGMGLGPISSGLNKILFERYGRGSITGNNAVLLSDLIGKPLIDTRLVDNFGSYGIGDSYLGCLSTNIYFSADTDWTTTATSDDGSSIYLNGVLIASLSSCTATEVTLSFKAGWNKLIWVFNENAGADSTTFSSSFKSVTNYVYCYAYPISECNNYINAANYKIQLNGGTTEGTNQFTYNGNAAKTINITPASIGAAASSHGTHVTYSSTAPKVAGTAAVGSEGAVARGDHVHAAQTSVSGNAGTATKLATARTLTVGNTGKTFDGSANVSWSLSEIGAAASSHTHTHINRTMITTPLYNANTGTLVDFNLNEKSGAMVILKLYGNSYSANPPIEAIYQFYDYSGGVFYNPSGAAISGPPITLKVYRVGGKLKAWFKQPNDYCTFKLEVAYGNNNSTPNVTLSNAAEPTGATETITITPNRVYSAAYKPTPADIGAATSSHGTHVTYATAVPKVAGTAAIGTVNRVAREDHVHPLQTSVSGNAGTATKLATARAIQIGNKSNSFDGSANITYTLADIGAAAASHNHGLLHNVLAVTLANTTEDSGWSMINSSYNGFLLKSIRTNASAPNWICNNYSAGIAFGGADTKGVISTAYNSPSIKFAGGNGSKPVWWIGLTGTSGTSYNLANFENKNHGTHVTYSTSAPLVAGTASVGSAANVARGDHIHPAQTSVSGNAGTATKLATARTLTIGSKGKTFDGSGNVSWSLSEILGQGTITTGDWNGANTMGVYEVSNFSGSNGPTGAYKWGGLLTLRYGNVQNQVYLSHGNNEMWIRGGWAGTWNGSWSRVYTTNYKPTLADIGHSVYTRSSVGTLDWSSNAEALLTKAAIAHWNGAYSGTTSNLAYCNRGAFGTIVTKNSGDYATASHTHNAIVSRGNVTAETEANRPAVGGLSMGCVYSNGYPTTYGNVMTMKGTGDGQLLIGWSGTSGAHAPAYIRSRRDTSDANWSGWAQIYTTAHKPTPADLGLQREYKSAVADIYSSGITTGGSTLAADTYASHGKSYSFTSTTTATTIYKAAFPELKYGKYAICVRMMSSNNTNTSNIAKIEILQGTTVKKTVNLTGKNFTSTSNYSYIYTDFEYTGNASAKQALSIQVSSLTVSGITLKFDYASIEMMSPAVFL